LQFFFLAIIWALELSLLLSLLVSLAPRVGRSGGALSIGTKHGCNMVMVMVVNFVAGSRKKE